MSYLQIKRSIWRRLVSCDSPTGAGAEVLTSAATGQGRAQHAFGGCVRAALRAVRRATGAGQIGASDAHRKVGQDSERLKISD
eukprot:337631-Pleurochrysis_carterae.AAC.1